MKLSVSIIKSQIRQIKSAQLREWLLTHFNEEADNLPALFGKQISVDADQMQSIAPVPSQIEHYSLPLIIFYTYASDSLRDELKEKFLNCSALMDEDKPFVEDKMTRELLEQLADFKSAWPIISSLYNQGVSDLIQILNDAEEDALIAFARLTSPGDVAVLVETFLVKNNQDLDLIDRTRLIKFLCQQDFTEWFTRYLDGLMSQASDIMSLKLLMLILGDHKDEPDKLAEIRAFLAEYPVPPHAQAIKTLIYYYTGAGKSSSSLLSNGFMYLFYDLVKGINTDTLRQLINSLNQECFFFIMELCIEGGASAELKLKQSCKSLLLLLCSETVVMDKKNLEFIKSRLSQVDSYLFNTPDLIALAEDIGKQEKALVNPQQDPGHALSDLRIMQLLTSPQFVASCTAMDLHELINRFFFLLIALTQEEYSELISSFGGEIQQGDVIQKKLENIKVLRGKNPNNIQYWHEKLQHIQLFANDCIIHALLIRLEKKCEQEKTRNLITAERALETLYNYYGQVIPTLRTDLLLRSVDYYYRPWINGITDAQAGQSVLISWFNKYHPNPLTPLPLQRITDVMLFAQEGLTLCFVNEYNEVITFEKGQAVFLIDTNLVKVNEPLYNSERKVIGYLTETGHLKSEGMFQRTATAQILAMVPQNELEQSSDGLQLLIKNMLLQETLDELYSSEHKLSSTKRLWLEEQVSYTVGMTPQAISSTTFRSLVTHHSDEAVFSLLGNIKHSRNAILLFRAILNDSRKCELLLNGLYDSDLKRFLEEHGAVECLADFMAHYHDKPFFAKGLQCFAQYGIKQKKPNLLGNALTLLTQETEREEETDAVLKSLIGSEDSAKVVLQEFLNDRTQTAIQQIKNPELNHVMQFFNKGHLVVALHVLNKMASWENNSLYKLVLHILASQHHALFQAREVSATTNQSWQNEELNEAAQFISRHLSEKSSLDSECAVGHKVFGELIFRVAKAGQTSLFYKNKALNPSIACLSFTRHFLERVVDKFWIPEGVKEQVTDTVTRIKSWVDEQSPLQKKLGNNAILSDWRHLIKETWKEINKKKLPVICAFLLNYSGTKKSLALLLRHYINTFQTNRDYIDPVVKLLLQFPQRDVSAVIFDVLEAIIIKKPNLLDAILLQCMAHYYVKNNATQEVKSPQAELALLLYFGRNKHYAVVEKGCDELAKICDDTEIKKRLTKAAIEANVEADLNAHKGYFYFGIMKFFKRLWYYGFNAQNNASGIVAFCDDDSPPLVRNPAADEVKAPGGSGKVSNNYLEFLEKRKQLISLLTTIKHCATPALLVSRASQTSQSLFNAKEQLQETVNGTEQFQERVVAQQQAVVHI